MIKKNLLILGSTGSIGCSTLDVVAEHREKFNIKTLVAKSNVMKLAGQAIAYDAENVVIADEECLKALQSLLINTNTKVFAGNDALLKLMEEEYDVVIAGIAGIDGLESIIKVIPHTKVLGIANKESIICGGRMLIELAAEHNTTIIPVDSEHSAIFQTLEKRNFANISRVTLTASGGPFLHRSIEDMSTITAKEAVAHPIWKMGAKISVDSATLMNKGLELIEAHYLFNLEPSQLDVVIHPNSIIHGFVSYNDGSVLAQMSAPDMKIPISLALSYPDRISIDVPNLDLKAIGHLHFSEPDEQKFPLLRFAKYALNKGHAACIILTVANEVAVENFLNGMIGFLDITRAVERALDRGPFPKIESLNMAMEFTNTIKHKMKKRINNIRLSEVL